jgi:acetate kinase
MATRAGSVDPGAILYLLRHGLSLDELDQALEHESGLLGLSGSASMREIEGAEDDASRLALEIFCYRIAGAIAAATVALGGLDAVVFTAGIGENSALVRRLVCARIGHLGVELDEAANDSAKPNAEIAHAGSAVRVVVLGAREDLVAARAARGLLGE